MNSQLSLLERLEVIERAATANGLALAKLQAECELHGYPQNRDAINVLVEETYNLLGEMKMVRLLCSVNEN